MMSFELGVLDRGPYFILKLDIYINNMSRSNEFLQKNE